MTGYLIQSHADLAILVCLSLIGAFTACHWLLVHVRISQQAHIGTIPRFLIAILLPPPLAIVVVGLGTLFGEFAVQRRSGHSHAVVLEQASFRVIVVAVGTLVAHLEPASGATSASLLAAAALLMWACDILIASLLAGSVPDQRPLGRIGMAARERGLSEAAQYLIGVLGVIESNQGVWTLGLLALPIALIYLASKNTRDMNDETRQLLESMADAVDLRDPYTGGHSQRVAEIARQILEEFGQQGPEVRAIVAAARAHDIGKIGIPDEVLLKPGLLTRDERRIMESHAERGADLLARYPDFREGIDIIRYHHEAWDGTGYPHHIKGTDIPFGSRVIAVADSFDAITTDRPYRKGKSVQAALAILREGRGRQWDPQIVDAFLQTPAAQTANDPVRSLRLLRPEDELQESTAAVG